MLWTSAHCRGANKKKLARKRVAIRLISLLCGSESSSASFFFCHWKRARLCVRIAQKNVNVLICIVTTRSRENIFIIVLLCASERIQWNWCVNACFAAWGVYIYIRVISIMGVALFPRIELNVDFLLCVSLYLPLARAIHNNVYICIRIYCWPLDSWYIKIFTSSARFCNVLWLLCAGDWLNALARKIIQHSLALSHYMGAHTRNSISIEMKRTSQTLFCHLCVTVLRPLLISHRVVSRGRDKK